MSIIERALGKFQSSYGGSHKTRPANEELLPRPGRFRCPTQRPERHEPHAYVKVNLDQLHAGILPLDERASDTLTHEFRRIKWPLLEFVASRANPEDSPGNLIMIASSVAGEGKTFSSFNLSLSIAREEDFSVLLVDADVVRRHITRLFGLDELAGLTDAVADPQINAEDLVLGTGIAGFCVLPAGRRSTAAPELFASQRMTDVLRALGRSDPRRIIVFDSSPLLATNEAQVLGRIVDQVVLVVRAESTAQPMVSEAIGLLDKTKQIRCVLNQSSASRLLDYYGHYNYGQIQE